MNPARTDVAVPLRCAQFTPRVRYDGPAGSAPPNRSVERPNSHHVCVTTVPRGQRHRIGRWSAPIHTACESGRLGARRPRALVTGCESGRCTNQSKPSGAGWTGFRTHATAPRPRIEKRVKRASSEREPSGFTPGGIRPPRPPRTGQIHAGCALRVCGRCRHPIRSPDRPEFTAHVNANDCALAYRAHWLRRVNPARRRTRAAPVAQAQTRS